MLKPKSSTKDSRHERVTKIGLALPEATAEQSCPMRQHTAAMV